MRPVLLGIVAAVFFSATYVLNARMSLAGGSFLWSASLRYLFMLPLFLIVTVRSGRHRLLLTEMVGAWRRWVLWSTVGFGLFYAPLCFASDYAPAWAVAGTFQLTIIAGPLLSPLFRNPVDARLRQRIPWRSLRWSGVMLAGILLIEEQQAATRGGHQTWLAALPVVVSAFAYPLGNRKMMALCAGTWSAAERILGMTIASLPFWLLLSVIAYLTSGWPPISQITQSAGVAVFSGLLATLLFFTATDHARADSHLLARVEATQAMEIVWTLVLSLLLVSNQLPAWPSFVGMALVVIGIVWQARAQA
ncbi:MAG: multidrug resistance efflux transporter family protein [Firmicutes bacterium]|nr:multidrug resistance efflux transporter family protein [Bacillota bacterium]